MCQCLTANRLSPTVTTGGTATPVEVWVHGVGVISDVCDPEQCRHLFSAPVPCLENSLESDTIPFHHVLETEWAHGKLQDYDFGRQERWLGS